MNPLMSFIPLLSIVVILIIFGSIIGAIAKRKHRNIWLWRVTGALGFPVALVAMLFFNDLNSIPEEGRKRSRLREKIILGAVIAIWTVSILMRFGASPVPNTDSRIQIKEAKELLDSWHGQGEALSEAKKILDRVLAVNPKDYRALKELSRYYIKDGYLYEVSVTNGRNCYSVGKYNPGTLEHAEEIIKTALQVNPNYAEGYVLLGHIYTEQSRLKLAQEVLAKAEALGTDDPWLYLRWADVLVALGETEKAADRCNAALEKGNKNKGVLIAAYTDLIDIYTGRREYEKVHDLYKKQFEIDPTNAWLRGNYALFLKNELGRFDEAISYAREALSIMDYGLGRTILAESLYEKWADLIVREKKPENQVREYYDEAFQLFPDLNLVMAYEGAYATSKSLVYLLKSKGIAIDAKTEGGSTALILASNDGRVDAVSFLLSLGANPNAKANNGWTSLHGAVYFGHQEIVKVLLENGAEPTQVFKNMDAATLAEKRGRPDIARLIYQYTSTHNK